jgi:alpha-glucuronidase
VKFWKGLKMRFNNSTYYALLAICTLFFCGHKSSYADDGYELWTKYNKIENATRLAEYQQAVVSVTVEGRTQTCQIIRDELKRGLSGLLAKEIPVTESNPQNSSLIVGTPTSSGDIKKLIEASELEPLGREGFIIKTITNNKNNTLVITANEDIGLLYGAFAFLRLIQTESSLKNIHIISRPRIQYRMLNHWDNLNGTVERGYAGRSLWKWDQLPEKTDPRYLDYARANASLGINGTVLNNVNANPEILKEEYLIKVAKLAEIFRPYGIKVFLSINFSSPISSKFTLNSRRGGIGNLETSDPMDPKVRQWWKDKAKEIYQYIPDFGGFLVKADSEGMPGPQDYNRTHADGANMLAEALEPYHGIVIWRAFVYNADTDPDRAKRAYMEFVPLDGKFHSNVFVQAKNGPVDFQPREPVQPLFGAMPKTPLMMELQITQEYLGHSTHLVYLAPMWKEYLQFDTYAKGKGSYVSKVIDGTLHNYSMTGIAGVTNIGDDRNWCGHLFAQANWYAFGRLAWDHSFSIDEITDEWIKMTLSRDEKVVQKIKSMMYGSWEACVNYMTPLGLHHIMQAGFHYGPQPSYSRSQRQDWTSVYYHRADSNGLGFDRSSTGSNATSQYFSPLKEQFDNIETCPEKYLLWFHHVPWDYKMKSGRTLWDELCYKYYSGTEYVDMMIEDWVSLEGKIDPEIFKHVKDKLQQQKIDAATWRDTCISYFQKFSEKPIKVKNELK